jgi:drug/metabolite transporter (DMT)-like permease
MNGSVATPGLHDNTKGILWMFCAALFFSAMVALIKQLGTRLPSFEIVFFRSSLQLAALFFVYCRVGFGALTTNNPRLQGWRALVGVLLINCNFYAFTQLPLADVTAIGFSRNLFLVVLALIFLGETLSVHRLVATLVGFCGIIIIMRPGTGVFETAAIFALAGAALGATMMVLIRRLTASDSNLVMMTYPAAAVTITTMVPAALFWVWPTAQEWLLIVAMAAIGASGQWCLIQAFRLGEATAVAPASYIRLVFASIIGFYVFAEIPDWYTLVGTALIVVGSLYLIYQEERTPKESTVARTPGDTH